MPFKYRFVTAGSLVALLIGFVLGLIVRGGAATSIETFMRILDPVESVWIGVLRLIVLPLIVSYLVLAVVAALETKVTSRIGGIALGAHVCLLVVVMLFTITVGPAILSTRPLSEEAIAAFQESAALDAAGTNADADAAGALDDAAGKSADDGVTGSRPGLVRVYNSIVSVDIVILLIASVLFSIVLSRLGARFKSPLLSFFRAVSRSSLWTVDLLLVIMPVVVLIVTFDLTAKIGGQFAGTLGFWLVLLSGLLFVATLALYAVAAWVGRVRIGKFARALLPVQALGVASRSSIVCLPKLIEAARDDLGQPDHVTGIVMPLSVSAFKLNRMVSTPMNLFFLAYLYGIHLDPAITASLIFTAMVVSFATPGIPSGGKFTTLPIYLAAGIPVEGVILLKAVDAIPDIFKTLINVTEDLTISSIVSRYVQAGASRQELPIGEAA